MNGHIYEESDGTGKEACFHLILSTDWIFNLFIEKKQWIDLKKEILEL